MLDRGDSEGWQVWARIRLAIEALRDDQKIGRGRTAISATSLRLGSAWFSF
jgi:hypothetical protein